MHAILIFCVFKGVYLITCLFPQPCLASLVSSFKMLSGLEVACNNCLCYPWFMGFMWDVNVCIITLILHLYKLPHSLKLSVKQKCSSSSFQFTTQELQISDFYMEWMSIFSLCVCALQILRGVTIPLFLNGRRSAFRITGSMCHCWTFAWQTEGAVPGRIRSFCVVLSLMLCVMKCKFPTH